MSKEELELLKRASIFSSLSRNNLEKLAAMFSEERYSAGSYIFREGDAGESFMLVKSGTVEIIKRAADGGSDIQLAERGIGEIFGEMAIIEKSPRFADARAKDDVSVLVLKKHQFEQLLGENSGVVIEIMGTLSSKLRQADIQMIKDLERKNHELNSVNDSLVKLAEELRHSNSDLARAKEFRDKIINNAPFFMIIADNNGKVAIMNSSAEKIFGISFSEASGKQLSEVINFAEKHDVPAEIDHALMAGGIWYGEIKTGRDREFPNIVEMTAINIASGGSDHDGPSVLFMGDDVTEKRHMQRQAFQLERMATRGEMGAEIAHELNNFLAIVSGNLELLVMDINRNRYEKVTKKTDAMKDGIGRIAKFVEGLMMVARSEAKMEIFDIHQFIDNELFFLKPQIKFKDIEFVCNWGENVPSVEIDRGQLQQVLFNLLNNSSEALSEIPPGKRRVTIATSYSRDDEMIMIKIYDNGCGMSDDDYGKVFRQNFTTKKTGHGFGLLAVKRVVKSHGGRVSAEKGSDGGACFKLEFPRRVKRKAARMAQVSA